MSKTTFKMWFFKFLISGESFMGDYILEIAEHNRYISASRGHVIIKEKDTKLGEVIIDSLACVLLSSPSITLSKKFLERMAEENIPVVICGNNYLPISMALPTNTYFKQLRIAQIQVNASPVIKKQLWQSVIVSKIHNQAKVLQCYKPEKQKNIEKLLFLAERVRSGDSDNKEAQAARIYWTTLFGEDFYRNPDQAGINSFLNYGYAIVRAVCARTLCASGLLPLFGIHHRNLLNAFCLADDMMEPFRPFVDSLVYTLNTDNACHELCPKSKRALGQILRSSMYMEGEESTLMPIALKVAQNLVKSFENKKVLIQYPKFSSF